MITRVSRGKMFDEYKCANCGIRGRSLTLGTIEVSNTYNESKVKHCPSSTYQRPKRVLVNNFHGQGKVFANIKDGQEYDVIDPPPPYKDDYKGVWVMGVGEPIKLLTDEYTVIE